MFHHPVEAISTTGGTLIVDMTTGENVVIEETESTLSHIDHPDGTLILDHETRESVIIEKSALSTDSDSEPEGIQA